MILWVSEAVLIPQAPGYPSARGGLLDGPRPPYYRSHVLRCILLDMEVHLHFPVTEGGVDEAGLFHKIPRMGRMVCARCRATMKVTFFLTDYGLVDRIIDHLQLTFVADRPPPPQFAYQELLMAAEPSTECLSQFSLARAREARQIFDGFWLVCPAMKTDGFLTHSHGRDILAP